MCIRPPIACDLAIMVMVLMFAGCGGVGGGHDIAMSEVLFPVEVVFQDEAPSTPDLLDMDHFLDEGVRKTPVVQVMTGGPSWYRAADFFAYKDGDGPWRPMVPEAPGVYRFHIEGPSGKYAVAVGYLGQDAGFPPYAHVLWLRLFFGTTAEALTIPLSGPGVWPPPGQETYRVRGALKGWLGPDQAIVACGSVAQSVKKMNPAFDLQVSSGTHDLVAMLGGRGYIRRDLKVDKDCTLTIDIELEGFDLEPYGVTVEKPDPNDTIESVVDLLTARRTLLPGTPASGGAFFALPPTRHVDGDSYRLRATARLDETRLRLVEHYFENPTDVVVKFPLLHIKGEVSGPDMKVTWSDYPGAILYSAIVETARGPLDLVRYDLSATVGYLGQGRTLGPLDLSGVEEWALYPDTAIQWEIRAYQCDAGVEAMLAALEFGPFSKGGQVMDGLTLKAAVLKGTLEP